MAVALAECCFDTAGIGVEAAVTTVAVSQDDGVNRAAALFGESASRVIVSASPDRAADVLTRAADAGVPARIVGRTGGTAIRIDVAAVRAIDLPVVEAEHVWSAAIAQHFARRVA